MGSNNLGSIVSGMRDAQGAGNRVEAHSPGGRGFVQHLADDDDAGDDDAITTPGACGGPSMGLLLLIALPGGRRLSGGRARAVSGRQPRG